MLLEARAENCCSSTHVLKLDGRTIGKFEGRWFSEGLDIQMIGRRTLQLNNAAWLGSKFQLQDAAGEEIYALAEPSGFFTSSWDLNLSVGRAQLVSAGWFSSGFYLEQEDHTLANVERLGWCENGWLVRGSDRLADTDLILIGLLFHVIQQRRNRSHHSASGTTGT